ncbi:MAG: ABC transporter ATP-binding protein [Deltaproteobacteria bacterium]|nr:ABC transporter ATP-binding protein [Deltaproteobacteria bacterium]MBI3295044.1 ABC transporter ATP-binding protein [Deltaproteobacteria bacterium]
MTEIEFIGVTKEFASGLWRKKTAVNDVSFGIEAGAVVGILGANGSGKSTSIKMMLGFLKPTRGEIRIGGKGPYDFHTRKMIGYLPENPRFQKFLKAGEVLRYYGGLAEMKGAELSARIDSLLELVGLKHAQRERVAGFSKGMIQRLAIAQSLLHSPPVLIFDEPMSGLDPLGRREIRHLIQEIKKQMPVTILFSSHILSDVELLCQSVLLLKAGRLTRQCSVSELLSGEPDQYRLVAKDVGESFRKRFGEKTQQLPEPDHVAFDLTGAEELALVLAELQHSGGVVVSLTSLRRSLEDSLFLDRRSSTEKGAELL